VIRARALGLAVALFALPACTISKDYIHDRVEDLVDCVRVHVIVGTAFGAEAQVTEWFGLGFMYESDCWAWGLANRKLGTWDESIQAWGLILHDWRERVKGIRRYSGSYGWWQHGSGPSFSRDSAPLELFNVRASAAVFIGLDAEVRIGEIFDFVFGFLTWDIADDDGGK